MSVYEHLESFVSTNELAELLGVDRTTALRWCCDHPNFAAQLNRRWKIPRSHAERLVAGEKVAAIAASPSPAVGVAAVEPVTEKPVIDASQRSEARERLLTAYFFALAARHHDEDISASAREMVLARIAEDALAAIKSLGLVEPGGLRAALVEVDAATEFRLVTGVPTSF